MNWSPRFCASLSVRLSRLPRSRPTETSPPWPENLRQAVDRLVEVGAQRRHVDAGAGQQRAGAAIFLLEQRQQQVLRLDHLVVVADRQALGFAEACWNLVVNLSRRMSFPFRIRLSADGGQGGDFNCTAAENVRISRQNTVQNSGQPVRRK